MLKGIGNEEWISRRCDVHQIHRSIEQARQRLLKPEIALFSRPLVCPFKRDQEIKITAGNILAARS